MSQADSVTSSNYVVFITGANRGLGLEFVRQLLNDSHAASAVIPSNATIIAACRDPSGASELQKLQETHGASRLDFVALEVTDAKQIQEAADYVTSKYGRLDFLLNNAGLAEPDPNATPTTVSPDTAAKIFAINTIAPIEITKAFLPLMRKTLEAKRAELKAAGGVEKKENPLVRIVFISSSMGSIGAVSNATAPAYRSSKAALNMYVRCFAFEVPEIPFLLLHPGWVATDMGSRGNRSPPMDVTKSITACLGVIARMSTDRSAKAIEAFDNTTWVW